MAGKSLDLQRERTRPSPFENTLSSDAWAELEGVLEAVTLLVGPDTGVPITEIEDFPTATEALGSAWAIIDDAIARSRSTTNLADAGSLIDLMGRIRQLDITVRDAEARRRHAALQRVRPALARFQAIDSIPRLLELAAEVICTLGFDRALVSKVTDAKWVTYSTYVVGDQEWAEALNRVGKEEPAPLQGRTIPESEIVRRRAPVVVTDVQHTAHIHRPMANVSLAHSYVAAPLVVQSEVVGLVHGDRYFHRGATDAFDGDVLAVFAEGLSYAIERSAMQARLATMREGIRKLVDDPETADGGIAAALDSVGSVNSAIRPVRAYSPPPSSDVLIERLTRRELEIVRHLAHGETNARIASRLVLSEDTVKTHVKHILRKLGASNRAEAVSKWLLANSKHA